MSDTAAPFHYDIVGSFLRPEKLKTARAQFAEGAISHDELEAVENEAIKELVAQQKAAGLHAVTDGEFRRSMWHLDFLTELLGCEEVGAEHWSVHFKGHQPKSKTVVITDKVDFGEHPFLKHFAFTNSIAGGTLVKQTIPSPTMLHLICCVRRRELHAHRSLREQRRAPVCRHCRRVPQSSPGVLRCRLSLPAVRRHFLGRAMRPEQARCL